jgi:hypothetical protein
MDFVPLIYRALRKKENAQMKRWIIRLVYGALFALSLMVVTYALTQTARPARAQSSPPAPNCAVCHQAFQDAWVKGAHGMATTDPAFREAWEARGKPGECLECHVTGFDPMTNSWAADGITCQACHGPYPEFHPSQPMPADRSAQLCGKCHSEAYFEWQVSAHREKGLDCAGCHDPHAADLKTGNSSLLCASCHRERASNYAHSAHSQQGLACPDCHLGKTTSEMGEGHARQDHSFFVSLSTCTNCHAYQMHDPVQVHPERPTPPPPDAMASVETLAVTNEPIPVSPLGFTTLAGLIGVAFGVVIAPWLDRWQRRARNNFDETEK